MHSYFDHIVGNEPIKGYLTRLLHNQQIPQSLLFAGNPGVGKSLFAEAFARAIICSDDPSGVHRAKLDQSMHPDLRRYHPEGKSGTHSIDSMRHFSEEVYKSPHEAPKKVFLIYDADRMLTASANALLKTFEEPAIDSIIILISSAPSTLLPTVLSRCCKFYFKAVNEGVCECGGGALRELLLTLLAKGKLSGYCELLGVISEIEKQVAVQQKGVEDQLRTTLKAALPADLTASQVQEIEKEVEGAMAMRLAQESREIFDVVLSWYRDRELLLVGGNTAYLFNSDFIQQCQKSIESGIGVPLEKAQKAVARAKQALERALPLGSCLETLFIELNLV